MTETQQKKDDIKSIMSELVEAFNDKSIDTLHSILNAYDGDGEDCKDLKSDLNQILKDGHNDIGNYTLQMRELGILCLEGFEAL